jgi:Uma2 family endonuclease
LRRRIAMPTDTDPAVKLITAEEYATMPLPADGSRTELVQGEVVTMSPPSFLHGLVQLQIGHLLKLHISKTKSGRATVESGVLTELGPDTVHGPAVAYWSYATLPADQVPVVFSNVAPDLVAEVVSPSNSRKDIATKVREYFKLGAKMIWVVDPEERTATVYRKPGDGRVLWDDATITGEDVLPGFTCPVAEFFGS